MAYMTTSPFLSSASGSRAARNTLRTPARAPEAPGPMDWWLAAVVLTLLCIGLLMVLSTSGVIGERPFGIPELAQTSAGIVLGQIVHG